MAIGVALDTLYSARSRACCRHRSASGCCAVLRGLRLAIYHPALDWRDEADRRMVLDGLDEFREHLGGELTVLMLQDIGQGIDVHRIDPALVALHRRTARPLAQADGLRRCGPCLWLPAVKKASLALLRE